ncbi:SH3 domain-containing protein [Leptospira koniambonensis]|uniref:SH3 domain-containing protein n=1 Tax=Leptospira koniambonensis TaxID=2484950 RepID=UPI003EB7C63D
MNFRNIIILIITITLFMECKRFSEKQGYVIANNGLSFRQSPKIDSNKLSVIPRDEFFSIIDMDGPEDMIEGTTERWWKVNYKGQTGWLFGGFAAIYDPSFYDVKKSIYTGDHYVKNEFYNELKTYFSRTLNSHCQLNFVSNAFPSGDGDEIFDEVYTIEINTKIDSIAILSKYHSFSIRIINLERHADQIIISYMNSNQSSNNPVLSTTWELDKEKKIFFNKEKLGKGTNWDNLIYRPNNEKSYVCNSHLKSWLYPFL